MKYKSTFLEFLRSVDIAECEYETVTVPLYISLCFGFFGGNFSGFKVQNKYIGI